LMQGRPIEFGLQAVDSDIAPASAERTAMDRRYRAEECI
jgi:hypothetical protein